MHWNQRNVQRIARMEEKYGAMSWSLCNAIDMNIPCRQSPTDIIHPNPPPNPRKTVINATYSDNYLLCLIFANILSLFNFGLIISNQSNFLLLHFIPEIASVPTKITLKKIRLQRFKI